MKDDYAPRVCVPLQPKTTIESPSELPELVHMSDPAMLVFTDFSRVKPVVIAIDVPIDAALKTMKTGGVRFLLVVDDNEAVIGQITADDILGNEPIRLQQQLRMDRRDILVGQVMTPIKNIRVVEWSHMRGAKVGHIVATLHQQERSHLLVVEDRVIRGLFSASQISKQLGEEVMETALPAHSLAEIVRTLGQ